MRKEGREGRLLSLIPHPSSLVPIFAMSRTQFWILTVLLVGGAFYVFFVMLPGRQSELARNGIQGYGTVEYKDSRPTPDGTVYTVMLLYQDAQNKNHRHEVIMYDVGAWNDLKAKQDIKV